MGFTPSGSPKGLYPLRFAQRAKALPRREDELWPGRAKAKQRGNVQASLCPEGNSFTPSGGIVAPLWGQDNYVVFALWATAKRKRS